jgi:hypothetical protein
MHRAALLVLSLAAAPAALGFLGNAPRLSQAPGRSPGAARSGLWRTAGGWRLRAVGSGPVGLRAALSETDAPPRDQDGSVVGEEAAGGRQGGNAPGVLWKDAAPQRTVGNEKKRWMNQFPNTWEPAEKLALERSQRNGPSLPQPRQHRAPSSGTVAWRKRCSRMRAWPGRGDHWPSRPSARSPQVRPRRGARCACLAWSSARRTPPSCTTSGWWAPGRRRSRSRRSSGARGQRCVLSGRCRARGPTTTACGETSGRSSGSLSAASRRRTPPPPLVLSGHAASLTPY